MSEVRLQAAVPPSGDHNWALVLAAGEGTRLRSLTTMPTGLAVPKQFCSLAGGTSLLHDALERAALVAPVARTCVIVASQHETWWRPLPHALPAANVVVQPRNRGTAVGILLPLLTILRRDPEATLVILPSDHFVRDEQLLAGAISEAMVLARRTGEMVVLGIEPDEADPELGYVVPDSPGQAGGLCKVRQFIEKPDAVRTREVIRDGGLWNSFILAVQARTLRAIFEQSMPDLVTALASLEHRIASGLACAGELAEFYRDLPTLDFSRDVLQSNPQRLRVLRMPVCGWSDLGTPRRVADVLRGQRIKRLKDIPPPALHMVGVLNLAAQQARLQPL